MKVQNSEDIKNVRLTFNRGRFISEIPFHFSEKEKNEELSLAFKRWYYENGEKKLNDRLSIYTPKMNVVPSKVKLKDQKMRWGTCTPDGSIYLNWRIIMSPIPIVDYLLVHELAHLRYPDHSKNYWKFVQSIIPNYEQRKEWLRINGPLLSL